MAESTLRATAETYKFKTSSFTLDPISALLTPTTYQVTNGWPVWAYRSSNPLDPDFSTPILQRFSPTAQIYSLDPVSISTSAPVLNYGDRFSISLITEFLNTFEDFAVYPDATHDPADMWVAFRDAENSATGSLGTAWSRSRIVAFPPRTARFTRPRVSTGSLAAGTRQYLDGFQVSPRPVSTVFDAPLDYAKPRHLQVEVKPTRLNLSISPNGSTTNLQALGLSVSPTAQSVEGRSAVQVTVPAGNYERVLTENQVIEVQPGAFLAVSYAYFVATDLEGIYRIRIDFQTETGGPVQSVLSSDFLRRGTLDTWKTLSLVAQVPEQATHAVIQRVYGEQAAVTGSDVFLTAKHLIENSDQVGDFFDGDSGADYLWRDGDTPGSTWSYYYEDREMRNYILERVLRENVALGISVDQPAYGTSGTLIRTDTDNSGDGYGEGSYGSGAYGD